MDGNRAAALTRPVLARGIGQRKIPRHADPRGAISGEAVLALASGFARCRRRLMPLIRGDLPRERTVLDPTYPRSTREGCRRYFAAAQWGFELIKHDYTTFDVFGRWGFQMGTALTRDGWTFASGPT